MWSKNDKFYFGFGLLVCCFWLLLCFFVWKGKESMMKFVIEGDPISWKRPAGKFHRYDEQKVQKQKVRASLLQQWNNAYESENKKIQMEASNLSMAQSFEVSYTFLFSTKQFESIAQKNAKLWDFTPHNTKPDVDNLVKFYSDCANGILWKDDAQVSVCNSKKLFDENPRTEMVIMCKRNLNINSEIENVFRVFGPNKLKDFLNDVKIFNDYDSSRIEVYHDSNQRNNSQDFLSSIATHLNNFAINYGDELKKISKYKIAKL